MRSMPAFTNKHASTHNIQVATVMSDDGVVYLDYQIASALCALSDCVHT